MPIWERFWQWLAWHCPRVLIYWVLVRATTEATYRYPDTPLPELTPGQIITIFLSSGVPDA